MYTEVPWQNFLKSKNKGGEYLYSSQKTDYSAVFVPLVMVFSEKLNATKNCKGSHVYACYKKVRGEG